MAPFRVVSEELALLARVNALLDEAPHQAAPSEAAIVKELAYLRELLAEGAEAKDRAALTEQWHRQSAFRMPALWKWSSAYQRRWNQCLALRDLC